jgi:hypothetical protein
VVLRDAKLPLAAITLDIESKEIIGVPRVRAFEFGVEFGLEVA